MFWSLVCLLIGAVLLIVGAEKLVDGATILADVFSLPRAFVGLTLVALGTSAPELFVNVIAAFRGQSGIALANVSGSNLANLCTGLGGCAIAGGIAIKRADFGRDLMVFVFAPAVILIILLLGSQSTLPPWAVFPLSALLIYYAISLMGREDSTSDEATKTDSPSTASAQKGVLWFLFGIVALYGGGWFTVHAAEKGADHLGIDPSIVGLTVVALLTSIPDIAATWVAARRGENEMAVGNIIGSNISNVILVLNATVAANWIAGNQAANGPSPNMFRVDYLVVTLLSMLACFLAFKSQRLTRPAGWFMLIAYVVYLGCRVAAVVLLPGSPVAQTT